MYCLTPLLFIWIILSVIRGFKEFTASYLFLPCTLNSSKILTQASVAHPLKSLTTWLGATTPTLKSPKTDLNNSPKNDLPTPGIDWITGDQSICLPGNWTWWAIHCINISESLGLLEHMKLICLLINFIVSLPSFVYSGAVGGKVFLLKLFRYVVLFILTIASSMLGK